MRWVFLPGLDGTGLLLEPVVAQVPANTPCTLVRYPCHLKGSYQDYIAAAESSFNSGEPVALIGESFSGPVAITLAAKHSNVKALVLSGSFASSPRARFLRHLLHCLELCLTVNRTSFFFIRLLLAGMDAPEELVQRVARAGHLVPVSVLAHRLGMVLSCDERQTFAGLRIPVLALVAAQDRLVPGSYSRSLKALRPSAHLQILESPHLVLERKTGDAIARISSFLSQIPVE